MSTIPPGARAHPFHHSSTPRPPLRCAICTRLRNAAALPWLPPPCPASCSRSSHHPQPYLNLETYRPAFSALDTKFYAVFVSSIVTQREIRQFVNTYPNNYILVTCRLAGWKNQLPDFSVYEVQQFDDENIFAFIREWYKEVLYSKEISSLGFNLLSSQKATIENKVLAEANLQTTELINALHQSNDLLRVARNPLILSIITFLRYVGALELPKSRSWLYQRCL